MDDNTIFTWKLLGLLWPESETSSSTTWQTLGNIAQDHKSLPYEMYDVVEEWGCISDIERLSVSKIVNACTVYTTMMH